VNARKGVLLGFVLAALLPLSAQAQRSNGTIIGKAAPGTVVVVHNEGSGMHRELTVKANGRYEARNLPTGIYSVVLKRPDGSSSEPVLLAVHGGVATRVP
jgi:hypothetical protein